MPSLGYESGAECLRESRGCALPRHDQHRRVGDISPRAAPDRPVPRRSGHKSGHKIRSWNRPRLACQCADGAPAGSRRKISSICGYSTGLTATRNWISRRCRAVQAHPIGRRRCDACRIARRPACSDPGCCGVARTCAARTGISMTWPPQDRTPARRSSGSAIRHVTGTCRACLRASFPVPSSSLVLAALLAGTRRQGWRWRHRSPGGAP